jgi:hypothetical protein
MLATIIVRRIPPAPVSPCGWAGAARCLAVAALLALISLSGCVTRRMTIITDPPGATVYVDDFEVGTTPCSVSYVYYGTRKIVLIKDGFETRTLMQEFPTPWYQYFPVDFVTENLIPWEIRDERTVEYKLLPQIMVPVEQIQLRGEELRQNVQGQRLLNPPPLVLPTPQAPNRAPLQLELGSQPPRPKY